MVYTGRVTPNLKSHYALLLGLDKNWKVESVELDIEAGKVGVRLKHVGKRLVCPCCGKPVGRADYAPERTWRHLDTMQFETELKARIPRAKCGQCGVKTVEVPWAGKNSPFTWLFEDFALRVLEVASGVKAASKLLGLSWNATHRIMKRGVGRGVERRDLSGVRRVGIDEKSFLRGQSYVSCLCDLDDPRIIEVVEGRREEDAARLLDTLPEDVRKEVEAVAMDMWPAYVNAAEEKLPGADIVFDRFHVSKHMGDAVDAVRREEHRNLMKSKDGRLKGSRYNWLRREENIKEDRREEFEALKNSGLKTARAWAIKELLIEFWECRNEAFGEGFFKRWHAWAIRSRLEPVRKVAKMLKKHLGGLLSFFRHRITNAASEGFNSKIQSIKAAARGFRNYGNYRIRILFYCGNLDLRPDIGH
jgi:transposase